jgi:endoglucanase
MLVGGAALAVIIAAGLIVLWRTSPSRSPRSQETQLLAALWQNYKRTSWEASSGRTIDHQSESVTTSEGQGYTLLRAAWENDQPTFTKTWQWTAAHLQRPDKLFSWRWGTRADGSSGILTDQGGQNTASDADTDIAFALLLAYGRWHVPEYLQAAQAIVPAIWQQEVVQVTGKPVLAADNLERQSTSGAVAVNPSYFAPYAYRVFARLDPAHDWNGLVRNSYALIAAASQSKLDTSRSADLPPDWLSVQTRTGQLAATGNSSQTTDFSYDAFRTVWRTALDAHWSHDAQAAQSLSQYGFLDSQWSGRQQLVAVYGHDGSRQADYESVALYGGTLGYFQDEHEPAAAAIVQQKLLPLYDQKSGGLTHSLNYYDNNWAWFGLALYLGHLPNLAKGIGR